MRLGVLTSGGDCPGLNAGLRAVARRGALQYGDALLGFHDGWRGALDRRWTDLTIDACRGSLPRGGTILGTSRVTPYQRDGGVEFVEQLVADLELDGFLVLGGDGSLRCAQRLNRAGIKCIGVPKTIDNDVPLTEYTVGFDTAVQIATDAIDRLHTTAEAHDRVLVVEVMGRASGHIAARAGLAGGSAVTLVPEHPFDIDEVCDRITKRHRRGRWATVVVAAEGAQPTPGTWTLPEPPLDAFGHPRFGGSTGLAAMLGPEIERRTGFETRVTVLGHIQRGGSPTAFDRVLASRFGVAALDAAHDGDWGAMVAIQSDHVVRVRLDDTAAATKPLAEDLWGCAEQFLT